MKYIAALLCVVLVSTTACKSLDAPSPKDAPNLGLKFLGSRTIERTPGGVLKNFGGISGIDIDPVTGTAFLVSDDRSDLEPARFYQAKIGIDSQGFSHLDVISSTPLLQKNGDAYPNAKAGGDVPDPEALRIDPRSGALVWSSEGDQKLGLNPFVRRVDQAGRFLDELFTSPFLVISKDGVRGVRNNLAFEGLTYDTGNLWVAMEAPLFQDGPVANLEHGAFARFTKLSPDGKLLGQYAYPVDAIPVAPTGGKKRGDNGVSEILSLASLGSPSNHHLLVVERSGREVDDLVFQFEIRIYEADLGEATNVADLPSLEGASIRSATKRLVMNLNNADIGPVDNIEGAAWGPRLPNGHPTLVLVSDDNFNAKQVSQFLAFEVLGAP